MPRKPAITDEEFLTPRQVADILGVHYATLASWRARGHGPQFIKLGAWPKSPVRYSRSAVCAYLQDHAHN